MSTRSEKSISTDGASATGVRELALQVLLEAERDGRFVRDVMDGLHGPAPSPADRRLLTMLVNGSIRHRGTLDAVIRKFCDLKPAEIHPIMREILRQGLYQRLYLEKIPAYAAVNESVNLARKMLNPGAARLANAVLRAVDRAVRPSGEADADADPRCVLEAKAGRRFVFDRPVFPDPKQDLAGYLAASTSCPSWIVKRWLNRFGPERTREVCAAANARLPVTLRANLRKTTRAALLKRLAAEGVEARAGDRPESVRVRKTGPLAKLASFREGLFQVQDETATAVVPLLDPQPGGRVLDLCAAPGGKATHLAERMDDRGEVIAVDSDEAKVRKIARAAERLGLTIVKARKGNGTRWGKNEDGAFDAVLVDAPCSNTGVLARRVEARWRITAEDLAKLVRIQQDLLRNAARLVKPGGVLVYSTCSLEHEENEQVLGIFLKEHPAIRLEKKELTLPSATAAGGFAARMVKGTDSSPATPLESTHKPLPVE